MSQLPHPGLLSPSKKQAVDDEGVIILEDPAEAANGGTGNGQDSVTAILIDDD
jgi:hypothetical protein